MIIFWYYGADLSVRTKGLFFLSEKFPGGKIPENFKDAYRTSYLMKGVINMTNGQYYGSLERIMITDVPKALKLLERLVIATEGINRHLSAIANIESYKSLMNDFGYKNQEVDSKGRKLDQVQFGEDLLHYFEYFKEEP